MQYLITRSLSVGVQKLKVEMPSHDQALELGKSFMNNIAAATELTYTENNNRCVIRVMNAERMFAKIESI